VVYYGHYYREVPADWTSGPVMFPIARWSSAKGWLWGRNIFTRPAPAVSAGRWFRGRGECGQCAGRDGGGAGC